MLSEAHVPGPYAVLSVRARPSRSRSTKEETGSNAYLAAPAGVPPVYDTRLVPGDRRLDPTTTAIVFAPAQITVVLRETSRSRSIARRSSPRRRARARAVPARDGRAGSGLDREADRDRGSRDRVAMAVPSTAGPQQVTPRQQAQSAAPVVAGAAAATLAGSSAPQAPGVPGVPLAIPSRRPRPASPSAPVSSDSRTPKSAHPRPRRGAFPSPAAVGEVGKPSRRHDGLSPTGKVVSKRQQRYLFASRKPFAHSAAKRGAAFRVLPERKGRPTPRTPR